MGIEHLDRWEIIERVYCQLLDSASGRLRTTMVTVEDIEKAVVELSRDRSDAQLLVSADLLQEVSLDRDAVVKFLRPAFKGKDKSTRWPAALQRDRVSARLLSSGEGLFRFVDYFPGFDDPFPPVGRSEKPAIIQRIYDQLVDPLSGALIRTVVTSDDIIEAISWGKEKLGLELSASNPANFIKDVIRGKGASGMWPAQLKAAGITARQVTGDRKVFEFISYDAGQDEPFPDRFFFHKGVTRHKIQSVSLPLASKALGRDDETYLIQVAVKLAVVETHFALTSTIDVQELNHLQIGIKLRHAELDSLFAANFIDSDGVMKSFLITAEAKKRDQRILEEQIVRQVHATFNATGTDLVVPIAMTPAEDGIYIAEFAPVRRAEYQSFERLELATEALYILVPSVKGI